MLMQKVTKGEGELVKQLEALLATIAGMTKQDLFKDLIKANVDFNTVCFTFFYSSIANICPLNRSMRYGKQNTKSPTPKGVTLMTPGRP